MSDSDDGIDIDKVWTSYNTNCFTNCNVHRGWFKCYSRIQANIKTQLSDYIGKGYTLYISGHSLGASLSNLMMADYYCNNRAEFKDIILYNSAAPNIGDSCFRSYWNKLIPASNCQSLTNKDDPVPLMPQTALTSSQVYYPVGNRYNFTVNWSFSDVCTSPSMTKCICNHDPRCVYYYSLTKIAGGASSTQCDCTSDPSCDLCITSLNFYPGLGCPILKQITNQQPNKNVEL